MNKKFTFSYAVLLLLLGVALFAPMESVAQTPCAEADFTFEVKENVLRCKGSCTKDVKNWYWQFGDNTAVGEGQSISHEYAKGGEYQVCMKALVTEDCKVSVCKKIAVGTSTTSSGCGLQADFDIKTDSLTIYTSGRSNDDKATYYFQVTGVSALITGREAKFTMSASGTYEVCMTALNGAKNCKERVCKKVELRGPCNIQADFALIQNGDVVALMAKSTAGDAAKYYWSLGNGVSLEGKDVKYQYPKSGDYEICLKVVQATIASTAAGVCYTTVCKKVRVDGTGTGCQLKADYSYVTNGKVVNFAAVSNDPDAVYAWYLPWQATPVTGKDVQIAFDKEGTFDVCLVVTDAKNTCRIKVCKKVTAGTKIRVYPNPADDFINVASDTKINTARIYNQFNELKLTSEIQSTEGSIDISSLAKGVYIITLDMADGTMTSQKFLKR